MRVGFAGLLALLAGAVLLVLAGFASTRTIEFLDVPPRPR
jgi:hypothetical protein